MVDYGKDFVKLIETFRYKYQLWDVFQDWCEMAAAAVHQMPYHQGLPRDDAFEAIEAEYMAVVKRYERKDLDKFAELLGIVTLASADGHHDFLGSVFMELELGSNWHGQFFTPYNVSLMMAKMQIVGIDAHIERCGFFTLAEPACGAGGMIIAAAQAVAEEGYDPGMVMFFEATDVSRQCFCMTYIQTALRGLRGIVRHGNTLSNETFGYRFTPICRLFPSSTNRMIEYLCRPEEPAAEPAAAAVPSREQLAEVDEPLALFPDLVVDAPSRKPAKSRQPSVKIRADEEEIAELQLNLF